MLRNLSGKLDRFSEGGSMGGVKTIISQVDGRIPFSQHRAIRNGVSLTEIMRITWYGGHSVRESLAGVIKCVSPVGVGGCGGCLFGR